MYSYPYRYQVPVGPGTKPNNVFRVRCYGYPYLNPYRLRHPNSCVCIAASAQIVGQQRNG